MTTDHSNKAAKKRSEALNAAKTRAKYNETGKMLRMRYRTFQKAKVCHFKETFFLI